jgi:hypothetical protein
MAPTPPAAAVHVATRSRAVKERQLAIVEDPRRDLQALEDREIQVDDDWEDKLNLQVKIMYVIGLLVLS